VRELRDMGNFPKLLVLESETVTGQTTWGAMHTAKRGPQHH